MSNGHSVSNASDYPCWCAPEPNCVVVVNSGSATLATGILSIPGAEATETFRYFDIIAPITKTCAATAVAQVTHFTPSGFTVGTCCGDSAVYEIILFSPTCQNENDVPPSTYTITYNEDKTGAEIVDDFVALINADENAFVTATDGGNTLILTADTAGCLFEIFFTSDNIATVTPVANVAPWGTPAQVEADGADPDVVTASAYHSVDILFRKALDDFDQCANCQRICNQVCRVYFADNASGDTFISSLNTITSGADTASKYLSVSGTITGC